MSYLTAEADAAARQDMPKVVALGINRSAAAEVVGNPLYRCYSVQETTRLMALPRQARLVVMATRYSNPDTVLRMKQLAGEAGAKFIELVGGPSEFRRWLSRTNVERELGAPTVFAAAVGSIMDTDLQAPQQFFKLNNGKASDVPVARMAPEENPGEQPMSNAAEGTVKDLIKRYWAETGGSPSQLLKKAEEVGKSTTLASIAGAKSALLRKDGWTPPDGNGAKRRERPSAQRRIRPKIPPAGDSATELMQLGIAKIGEGLELIRQAAALTKGMESRLNVLEPLYAAFQQAVSAQQSSKGTVAT